MDWFDFRDPVSAWTHAAGCVLALPATVFLWFHSQGIRIKQIGFTIFGLSMMCCYAGSTLYHGVRLTPKEIDFCEKIDHMGIYLLIAGTITPLALVVLRGWWRLSNLIVAWTLAVVGITLNLVPLDIPDAVSTGIYLGMGWGMVFCYFELVRALSHQALLGAVTGGMLYTVGAVINLVKWPNLWPGVFAAHELFHVFVMAGSLAHFVFMVRVVAPYQTETSSASRAP